MDHFIVGVDLGTKTGVTVLNRHTMNVYHLQFGSLKEEPTRYKRFWDCINKILANLPSERTTVYYEYVARHLGTKAAHAYGAYRMILLMACHDLNIPYEEVSVQAVKKAATGKGKVTKEEMIEAANEAFRPDWTISDNEADSMWMAYLGLKLKNESDKTIQIPRHFVAVKRNSPIPNDIIRKRSNP